MTDETVSGRADVLRSAAAAVPCQAVAALSDALAAIRDQLVNIVQGAAYGEEVILMAALLVEDADDLFRQLLSLRNELNAVAERQKGTGGPPSPGALRQTPPTPQTPAPVTAADGSQYPAGAAWAIAEGMPPRVERGTGARTVGYIRVNDVPMRIQSGDDGHSDMVDDRLREAGIPGQPDLRRHVEMKVAARMMGLPNTQHEEVVINHAPCGSETGGTEGCHELLPYFLREGYSLTVHGSNANGKPFTHTYRGKTR